MNKNHHAGSLDLLGGLLFTCARISEYHVRPLGLFDIVSATAKFNFLIPKLNKNILIALQFIFDHIAFNNE